MREKLPEFPLILTVPSSVEKSSSGVTLQYKVVPFDTFVVVTLQVPADPSFILVGAVKVNVGVVSAPVVTVNVSLTPPTVTVAPTAVEKELEDNTLTCKYCPFVIVLLLVVTQSYYLLVLA